MNGKREYNSIDLKRQCHQFLEKYKAKHSWANTFENNHPTPTIAFDRNRIKFAIFPRGFGFVDAVHDRAGNDVLGDVGNEVVGKFQPGIRVPHLNV